MAKFSSIQIRKKKQELIKLSGPKCAICSRDFTDKIGQNLYNYLILDHIDNNPHNNEINNFQLLCRACNKKKNPAAIVTYLRQKNFTLDYIYTEANIKEILQQERTTQSIIWAKHLSGDPAVRRYVFIQCYNTPGGSVDIKRLIPSCMSVSGFREKTVREILKDMTSDAGDFMMFPESDPQYIKFKGEARQAAEYIKKYKLATSNDFKKKFDS